MSPQSKRASFSRTLVALCAPTLILGAAFFGVQSLRADSASDIQAKIAENNQKIANIQKQIDQYSTLLNSSSKQAQTLADALKALQLTQQKLEANLALTQTQISKTSLTLQSLTTQVSDTEKKINFSSSAVAESLRQIEMYESQSAVEMLLDNRSISDAWDYVNSLKALQTRVESKLADLHDLHDILTAQQDAAAGEKSKLLAYQKNLSDQQKAAQASKDEKNQLLAETKNQQSEYQKLIAQKTAERVAYEKELFDYESQLKLTLQPGQIPAAAHGILAWPLDSVYVTQYFGSTVAARRLYTSGSHNGVDFRASIGTPIKAAMSGVVTDTEPTKSRSGCQYGKFVLIKHPNGLSTIYGHLSVVSVKPGDPVVTGDIIGYSGSTGYATGPHLHLGLYVTSGIQIVDSATLVKPPAISSCAGIKTVAAPHDAYLDPMAYLPNL